MNTRPGTVPEAVETAEGEAPARPRVAVLVDNVCLADNRVIRSAEHIASCGYEVRVFCRDRRKPVGDSEANGVYYQRNWVAGLLYERDPGEQRESLRRALSMPARFSVKLTLVVEAFMFMVAFALKTALDDYSKVAKAENRDRNRAYKRLRNQSERAFDKRVRAMGPSKSRAQRSEVLVRRARYKLRRTVFHGRTAWLRFWRKMRAVLRHLPQFLLYIVPFSLGLLYIAADRLITRVLTPGGRVATAAERVRTKPDRTPRMHTRILRFILEDKGDKSYLCRAIILKAARIYTSVEDEIAAFAPDIVHAHDLVNLPVGYWLGERTGAKVIYDAHEYEAARDRPHSPHWKRAIVRIERHYITRVDAAITMSPGLAEKLADLHGLDGVTVIMNTPDPAGRRAPENTLRQELGLAEDVPLGLYVGGLKITRGLPFFLEAAATIPDLHIAACGPRTKVAEQAFAELAESLGMADRFYMVGPEPIESLLGYIRGCDFSIMPTQALSVTYIHAMPNKFFESMLAGIPLLVGKNIVEMARIVKDRGLGVLLDDQTDPADIAIKMREVLERSEAISAHMKAQDLSEYEWPAQARRLEELFATVQNPAAAVASKDPAPSAKP